MADFKVSIVIVNYNVKDLILACIDSVNVFVQNSENIQIIVVDNNSSDGSVEAIKIKFPQVFLIENKDNAGFPKANNQGFEVAKGEFIFMLNPDTELVEDSIASLQNFMNQNQEISLLAPKLLNSNNSLQQSIWKFPSLKSVFLEMHYLNVLLKNKNYAGANFENNFQVESCSGAAIFFRRSLLEKLGNLDETMFWIEDIDFCYRANKLGFKLIYFPETKIIHHIGQSAKKNYNISISNQVVNKIKFFKKHYSYLSFLLVTLLSAYHVIFKILLFSFMSPFNVVYFRKLKAYIYTFPRVFNPPQGIK